MVKVVGLGAGGHAKVVIEALRCDAAYELVGLLDPDIRLQGGQVLGVPVLGDDSLLAGLAQQGVRHFFVGVGAVGDMAPRRRLFEYGLQQGLAPISIIHPRATVSPSAVLGSGITILAGAIVNAQARIGKNVIVNTGAVVEHDCMIGDHVHIATGAKLASTVQVGDGTHIGIGASIRQCICIGRDVTVGAGAVVVGDIADGVVAVGVPARILRWKDRANG